MREAPTPTPASRRRPAVALAVAVALAAAGTSSALAVAIHYTVTPYTELQRQIGAHQVKRATINKKAHQVKVTLTDGRHERVSYPSHQEPQLAAQLRSAGSTVKLTKHKVKAKSSGHRLRYIAGGIVVLLGALGGAFFLADRRRRERETVDPAARPPGPPPPGPAPPGP